MIGKAELLGIAAAVRLNPHVVEKYYALGWALAGIFAHPKLRDSWVFKGGTLRWSPETGQVAKGESSP